MYYYIEQDNLPLTLDTAPVINKIKLGKGRLDFVDIGFPDWCSRLGKCRLFYNSIQILPWNRNEWFTGDNVTVRVPINMMLNDEPYEITIQTINDDDTFHHELSFGFSMDFGVVDNPATLQSLLGTVQVQGG